MVSGFITQEVAPGTKPHQKKKRTPRVYVKKILTGVKKYRLLHYLSYA